jgi:Domain of unknown function (DUF1902)
MRRTAPTQNTPPVQGQPRAFPLPWLNVEAKTVDKLIDKLPGAVTDFLEESTRLDNKDISIDLVTRVRCRAVA